MCVSNAFLYGKTLRIIEWFHRNLFIHFVFCTFEEDIPIWTSIAAPKVFICSKIFETFWLSAAMLESVYLDMYWQRSKYLPATVMTRLIMMGSFSIRNKKKGPGQILALRSRLRSVGFFAAAILRRCTVEFLELAWAAPRTSGLQFSSCSWFSRRTAYCGIFR